MSEDSTPAGWTSCGGYFLSMLGRINNLDPTKPAYDKSEPFPVFSAYDDCRSGVWPYEGAHFHVDTGYNLTDKDGKDMRLKGMTDPPTLRSFYVPFNFIVFLSEDNVFAAPKQVTGPYEGISPPVGSTVADLHNTGEDWTKYKYVKFQRQDSWAQYIRNMCMGSVYQVGSAGIVGGIYNLAAGAYYTDPHAASDDRGHLASATNKFQRGSPACDQFMETYCPAGDNLSLAECRCFQEIQWVAQHYGIPEDVVNGLVICFGPTCSQVGYITRDMKKTQCSVPFCFETVKKYQSNFESHGETDVLCNSRWVPVAPTEVPQDEEGPPDDSSTTMRDNLKNSPTWVFYVIGGGVLALAILIMLVIIFVRKKKPIG